MGPERDEPWVQFYLSPGVQFYLSPNTDCTVELDTNNDSVPWRLIGETVSVVASDGRVCIHHRDQEVAVHPETGGRRVPLVDQPRGVGAPPEPFLFGPP
ncbi:MAG: Mu transposase domain-containing protein [Acetobacteraceae bacterium]